MEVFPNLTDCIFTHYFRDNFECSKRVFATGVRLNGNTKTWPADNEQEEISAIESLYKFLSENPEKIIVHWNMNSDLYGHAHFFYRYKSLTGLELPTLPNSWFDLSKYLWEKYEDNYSYIADKGIHPRTVNICELNSIKWFAFDPNKNAEFTAQQREYYLSTNLKALDYILHREVKGILRVSKLGSVSTEFGFAEFIKVDKRDKLMPFLIDTYKGEKPQPFGYMLYALHNLDLIIGQPDELGDVALHKAISETFKVTWSRQALTTNINKLNEAAKADEVKIKQHVKRISDFLYPMQA